MNWWSFIQILIIQMAAHIVNNHIIMAFYIDCIHTDICEQSVITCWLSAIQMVIIQIQSHSPQNTQTYMKNVEKTKKGLFGKKKQSLSYAPIRWQVRHSVRHTPSRGSPRIEINNLPRIFNYFFFGWSHSVCETVCYKTVMFFTTKTLFLSVICSITDTNNNSPWRNET